MVRGGSVAGVISGGWDILGMKIGDGIWLGDRGYGPAVISGILVGRVGNTELANKVIRVLKIIEDI